MVISHIFHLSHFWITRTMNVIFDFLTSEFGLSSSVISRLNDFLMIGT